MHMTTASQRRSRFLNQAVILLLLASATVSPGMAAEPPGQKPNFTVHVFWGCHSSYFFTPLPFFQPAVDMLFASLEANPDFKVVMELDPYTLKRMKEGEKFAFEKYKNEGKTLRDDARLEQLRHYAKRGQIEIIGGAYTQPIMGTLGDEAVIHQFTHGMRAVEEALGVPVKIYGYQEDGSCSQIPQILNAAGFEAVVAETFFGANYYPPAMEGAGEFLVDRPGWLENTQHGVDRRRDAREPYDHCSPAIESAV